MGFLGVNEIYNSRSNETGDTQLALPTEVARVHRDANASESHDATK